MEANTGWSLGPEAWRERSERGKCLRADTEALAEVLERQGVSVRVPASGVVARGDVTGLVEEVSGYRAIRILPEVAQRDRAPMLNALRLFQETHPKGRFIRMAVITAGERVPIGGALRPRMQKLARTVSRWASEARTLWSVEVVFRGTEFPTTTADGVHAHSHVLYLPLERIPPERWSAFLAWSHKRFGAYWQDNGVLEKPEEALKYPFKPGEMRGLPGGALAWLYYETRGLKLAQPMGAFAGFLRDLEAAGEKVVMVQRKGGRGAVLRRVVKPAREAGKGGASRGENVLIGRTFPQARFCPYAEPVSLVQNYTPEPTTAAGRLRLTILEARTVEARVWWDANGAPNPAVAVAAGCGQAAAEPGCASVVVALPSRPAAPPFKVHTIRPTVPPALPLSPPASCSIEEEIRSPRPSRRNRPPPDT